MTMTLLGALVAGAACAAADTPGAETDADIAFRADASAVVDERLPPLPALVVGLDGQAVMPPPPAAAPAGEFVPTLWTMALTPTGLERLRAADAEATPFSGDDNDHFAELSKIVGATELGAPEFYFPDDYLFVAEPAGVAGDRPVVAWPEFATIPLADASTCRRLPELEVGEAFATAAAASLFDDDGVLYEVVAIPAMPGATC